MLGQEWPSQVTQCVSALSWANEMEKILESDNNDDLAKKLLVRLDENLSQIELRLRNPERHPQMNSSIGMYVTIDLFLHRSVIFFSFISNMSSQNHYTYSWHIAKSRHWRCSTHKSG
jgi:hypothetical protein